MSWVRPAGGSGSRRALLLPFAPHTVQNGPGSSAAPHWGQNEPFAWPVSATLAPQTVQKGPGSPGAPHWGQDELVLSLAVVTFPSHETIAAVACAASIPVWNPPKTLAEARAASAAITPASRSAEAGLAIRCRILVQRVRDGSGTTKESRMTFLPPDFSVPQAEETARFRLRPITIHDVVKDYDAVMSSREQLWDRFGELWGWPAPDLSLEQDLIDLAWHQKEGQIGSTFTYAVMAPDESRLLGCVYVDPPVAEGTEADIRSWVRTDELGTGLESELEAFVIEWLGCSWPFSVVSLDGETREL